MEVARYHSSSPKNKLRSPLCLSCCFRSGLHETQEQNERPRLTRSPSSWLRSRAHELPEIKVKCWNLFCRLRKGRRSSSDFRYDPLSYSLNFDQGSDDMLDGEIQLRSFSARLPASPPMSSSSPKIVAPKVVVSSSRQIATCG